MRKRRKRREPGLRAVRTARQAATLPGIGSRLARYRSQWIVALLVAVTVVAYLPAMRGGLLWDDDANITKPELRSIGGLYRIWFDPSSTAQYYPLVHTTFWLEHKLWGDAVLGYHLVNVLWHALAISLVYSILRKLNVPGALLATSIFALHPVVVESVAWITEQKNTLSAVFYLSAMRLYLNFDQSRTGWQYLAAWGLFVLAVSTKTATVTLPVALLVILWWQRGALSLKRDIWPLAPYFVFSAAAGLMTVFVERTVVGAEGADFDLTYLQRSLLAGRAIWFYLSKLVWPSNLTFIYPRWTIDPAQWWQWIFPIAAILMTVVLWAVRTRWRAPLAGWLFFCATLFPVLGFLNVYFFLYSFVADHFQYLAGLGVIVPLAAWFTLAVNSLRTSGRWTGRVACAALVVTWTVYTMHQSAMYGNVVALYQTTILRNPECWMAYNNLGAYLSIHDREGEAEPLFREAIRLRPDYPEALVNLGGHLSHAGQFEQAIDLYQRALAVRPDFFQAQLHWGNSLVESKRPQDAIEHYQAAARLDPKAAMPEYNLANTLRDLGDAPGAIQHYESSLQLKPDFVEARYNLGLVLAQTGRLPEAVDQFRSAVELRPEYAAAHHNLGVALAELRLDAEAVEEFRKTLQLDPNYFTAQPDLAKAYARLQRPEDAIATAKEALASARSTGHIELASQIEAWLAKYQAQQAKGESAPIQP